VSAECSLKTSKRLQQALSERLVDSQRWESAHSALIKEKGQETNAFQQSCDELEKQNSITSRTIMEVKQRKSTICILFTLFQCRKIMKYLKHNNVCFSLRSM
jgi:hypothetical protein